jgi:hypothetical protein
VRTATDAGTILSDAFRWDDLDDEQALEVLVAAGLSDGLPVVRPTPRRIDAALRANGYDPERALGGVPPRSGALSMKTLAAYAVLAGCKPEHLPVVVAAVRALQRPELNALGVLTTTGSAAFMLVVNGPVRSRCAFNAGSNCLGPGSRGNACVGRALSLIVRNVGGARPADGDMSTMGQPGKYTFCFAENEEESPWPPLHVERGFARDASTLTMFAVAGTVEVVDTHSVSAADRLQTMADVMSAPISVFAAAEPLLGSGYPIVVLPPEWARALSHSGLTKSDVKHELYARARVALERLPAPLRLEIRVERRARLAPVGTPLRIAARPEDISVIVAGGVGMKQTFVPGWNGGSRSATVEIA